MLKVKVKMTSNNQIYDVTVDPNGTILDLKNVAANATGVAAKDQNLVYKGKILVDSDTISKYGIQNDHTLILVKKFAEAKQEEKKPETTTTQSSSSSTNQTTGTTDPFSGFGQSGLGQQGFGGFGQGLGQGLGQGGLGNLGGMPQMGMGGMDPNQLSSMMNNPMYMQMMNEMLSDPNTLNMVMNSPQLKPILDANPHLRQMMSNPQMMQMMMNPQTIQSALGMMGQGGMGGLGGLSGMPNLGGMGNPNTESQGI